MELLLVVLALPVALLLLALVARMWEPRLVWPYVSVDGGVSQATNYMARTSAAARALGFSPEGVFRDGKGRLYRVRYELWSAPQRDVLLLVGGGTVAGIPVDGSWLFTRLGDGRCIASIDTEAGREHDLTGLIHETVYPRTTLDALLDRHRQAVAACAVPPVPYSDPVSDHRDLLRRRVHALVSSGHATFRGGADQVWRYTAKGALAATLGSYWRGVAQGVAAKVRR
jgi:hypothetical protein